MPLIESRGRRAFVVESEYVLRRPEGIADLPVVLLLHGWGETAEGFATRLAGIAPPAAALLFAGGPIPVEVGEPTAPRRIGASWYCYDGDQERFRESLEDAEAFLDALLDDARKKHGVDPSRLVVVGYSQGAYLAGFLALRRSPRPLGLALLAGRLKHEFLEDRMPAVAELPVLLARGKADTNFPLEAAEAGRERLVKAGAAVRVFEHEGGHGLGRDMLGALESWLLERFPPPTTA